jgi:hypothetical protein
MEGRLGAAGRLTDIYSIYVGPGWASGLGSFLSIFFFWLSLWMDTLGLADGVVVYIYNIPLWCSTAALFGIILYQYSPISFICTQNERASLWA